jgi:hypothetical protein
MTEQPVSVLRGLSGSSCTNQIVSLEENDGLRISVILQRSCRMTLEELSRVSQAMAIQSYLLCFFYRQAGE